MQLSNRYGNILKTTINRFVYIANNNLLLYSNVIIIIIMGFGKSIRFVKGGIGICNVCFLNQKMSTLVNGEIFIKCQNMFKKKNFNIYKNVF